MQLLKPPCTYCKYVDDDVLNLYFLFVTSVGDMIKAQVALPFALMALGGILHIVGFATNQWSILKDDVTKYASIDNGLWKICFRRYGDSECATIPKELVTGW